jgi:hypothetical protein
LAERNNDTESEVFTLKWRLLNKRLMLEPKREKYANRRGLTGSGIELYNKVRFN